MIHEKQTRITWLDIAKAITIFLVVLGHTLRGGIAQQLVYSFHVATFFFLSGMTCKVSNPKTQLKRDFLRIMAPYYAFGLLSILIFLVLGQFVADKMDMSVNTSLGNNLLELLYACPKGNRLKFNMPLWFLPCLFVTKAVYYGIHHLCRGQQKGIFIATLLLATAAFAYTHLGGPSLPFNFSVALKMLLFFALGRIFSLLLPSLNQRWQRSWHAIGLGILLLALTISVALLTPKVNYSGDTFPNIATFLITAHTGSLGICFLSMGIGSCRVFEYVGKSTLAILVMHKFPILLFQTVGPLKPLLAEYNSLLGIAAAVGVSLISMILCLIAEWIIRRIFPFLLGDFTKFPIKAPKS